MNQAKQEVLTFLCTKSQAWSECVWGNLLASRMSDKVSQAVKVFKTLKFQNS